MNTDDSLCKKMTDLVINLSDVFITMSERDPIS